MKVVEGCDNDGTSFPLEYFVRAVYRLLIGWAEDGVVPPQAERIEMASIDTVSVASRDEFGNALGGVRSPFVDVPLAAYRGGDTGGVVCGLAGVEEPLGADVVASLYDGIDDYLARFGDSLAMAIGDGHLLPEDEAEIMAFAETRAAVAFGSS